MATSVERVLSDTGKSSARKNGTARTILGRIVEW